MLVNIFWLGMFSVPQLAAAEAYHQHNHTEPTAPGNVDDKIKDAISSVLKNAESNSNQLNTYEELNSSSVNSAITGDNDSHLSIKEAKKKEYGEIFGRFDEVPESGNSKVADEVENLFLDQVNVRIEEFEDLKKQIAVLEQHLRKHSDFAEFNDTENMLAELDEKAIKPYEVELAVLKKKIVNSDHEMNKSSIEMINTIVDDAEKFLEINRERVYSVLDDHVASKEHMHEHDDGSHSPEKFADYVDLIDDYETMVVIEEAETELLIEYIDMDIEEFKEIEKQKLEYEKQIKEQFNLENVEPDELQLKVAEEVLKDMNVKDIKTYEEMLLSLRTRIVESNGKLDIKEIDEMTASLGEVETYLDDSNNKLKLVGVLEQEFQEFVNVESNIQPPKISSVRGVSSSIDDQKSVEKIVDDGDSKQSQQNKFGAEEAANKNTGEEMSDQPDDQVESVRKEYQTEIIPFHFSLSLVILILILLVVLGTAFRLCTRTRTTKSCEDGQDAKSHLLSSKSPKLEMVKEHEGWSSRNWTSRPNRRKQL